MDLIEQALLDISVSWPARSLYAFMLARRYERPLIQSIANDTAIPPNKVSRLISELMVKGWLIRKQSKHGSHHISYDFIYKGHPILRHHPS